jgi:nucleotide-binding universal stress UspA family protein
MNSVHRILVPVDFSEYSGFALQHAIALARWYKAEILGVHVADTALPEPGTEDVPRAFPGLGPLLPGLRQELIDQTEAFLEPARQAGVRTGAGVLEGHPARALVDHALSLPADLIVMGTHGRRGFERYLLGSVTERIVRRAPCPVLTVPRAARELPEEGRPPFRTILCPVDFSGHSMRALEFSMSLAEESDASLILVHALEWLPEWDATEGASVIQPGLPDYLESKARDHLASLLEDDVRTFARPEILVVRGKAYREILRLAAERDAEVIVMGLQGRGAIDLAVFGSTTNSVVREAACPVLTLRAD